MTASLSKLLLAAGLGLLPVAALAQAMPHDLAPSLESASPQPPQPGPSATPPSAAIHETLMEAPPVEGFGTVSEGNGGLPVTVWNGSTRETLDPLLGMLRFGVGNATLQDLTTRLLVSQATPPQGQGASWFLLRLETLMNMGQEEKAGQMIAALPASMMNPALLRLQAEIMLLRADYDHACGKVNPAALPAEEGTENFWRKLGILCQARAGKQEEAMLGIDLMREENHADDLFFQEAVRKLADKKASLHALPKQWTPLNVALLRLNGETGILKDKLELFPPLAVKSMALEAGLDPKLKEKALLRAVLLGILPPNEGNRPPEQPFAKALGSDVTTLVTALGSGNPATDADTAVMARLPLDDAGANDSRRIERLLTLMEPFGYRVPWEAWRKLYAHHLRFDGEVPPASLLARLGDASQGGRKGEAILLSSLILGSNEVDKTTDLALLPVIKALKAVGYDKEARAMAFAAVKSYNTH